MQWKYEKMVDTVCQAICSGGYGPEAVKQFLMHLSEKVYEMGRGDAPVEKEIPVTDLTHVPEVFDHARARWGKGVCS